MRLVELYTDYSVPFVEEGDHKHARPGWVNVECPFCTGNEGYHLGYELAGNKFHCWRCGGKFADTVISKLLHISQPQARKIIKDYGGKSRRRALEKPVKVNLKPFKYPTGKLEIKSAHRTYLTSREFDAEKLERVWGVTGTGAFSFLDGVDYSKRILAPIEWNKKVVSFQTRDITNNHPVKYLACPQAREDIEHQTILYGKQSAWKKKRGVCVEGITDVWRMGERSFGVFGIDYTRKQVKAIKDYFEEVVVLFDPDPQAMKQAEKLIGDLQFLGVKAWKETLESDPGDLSQKEADYIMKQLLK